MTTKKKLSEVQTVTELKDSEFITVTLADESVGKIKKSDLYPDATDLESGVMSAAIFKTLLRYRSEKESSFDKIKSSGYYMNMNNVEGAPGSVYGMLIVFTAGATMITQIYFDTSSRLYIRHYSSQKWNGWRQITLTEV